MFYGAPACGRQKAKFRLLIPALLLLAVGAVAQSGGTPPAERSKNQSQLRALAGQVLGHEDAPLTDAVVYLKNTKTLAVRTYITKNDGQYQFHALAPNVDYEIYAQVKDKKSDTKTLSAFDSRPRSNINLHIDTK
jgi:hypothetical protein